MDKTIFYFLLFRILENGIVGFRILEMDKTTFYFLEF